MTVSRVFTLLFLVLLVMATLIAEARVKLAALPQRERAVIQLQNAQFTLVEEERVIPLLAGSNAVDFAWGNSGIDKNHFVFRLVDPNYPAKLLSVSFPPNENALVWAVGTATAGSAALRISYLLPAIQREFHYRALVEADETALQLGVYLRVANRSSEGFASAVLQTGFGESLTRPLQRGETREVVAAQFADVPVVKRYRADASALGYLDRGKDQLNVQMGYELRHDQLGDASLPPGKARIFLKDPQQTVGFIGEDTTAAVPPGDVMRLQLGLAQDVVVKRRILSRDVRPLAGNALVEQDVVVGYSVENFKDQPVELTLGENVMALRSELGRYSGLEPSITVGPKTTLGTPDPEYSDFSFLQFRVTVPPKADRDAPTEHQLHLTFHNEW